MEIIRREWNYSLVELYLFFIPYKSLPVHSVKIPGKSEVRHFYARALSVVDHCFLDPFPSLHRKVRPPFLTAPPP